LAAVTVPTYKVLLAIPVKDVALIIVFTELLPINNAEELILRFAPTAISVVLTTVFPKFILIELIDEFTDALPTVNIDALTFKNPATLRDVFVVIPFEVIAFAKEIFPTTEVELFTTNVFVEMMIEETKEFETIVARFTIPFINAVFVAIARFAGTLIVPPVIVFPTAKVTVPNDPLTNPFPLDIEPLVLESIVITFELIIEVIWLNLVKSVPKD
jgi:hypothetical protein